MYLAVTLQHAEVPFMVEVEVHGKLRGHLMRAVRSKFKTREPRRVATISPQVMERDLAADATNLDIEIQEKNVLFFPR